MLWTWIVVALDTKMARLQDSVMLAKLSLDFFWAPYQIRRSRRYDELEESLIAGLLVFVYAWDCLGFGLSSCLQCISLEFYCLHFVLCFCFPFYYLFCSFHVYQMVGLLLFRYTLYTLFSLYEHGLSKFFLNLLSFNQNLLQQFIH